MSDKDTKDIYIVDAAPDDVYEIRNVQKEIWLDTYPNSEFGITIQDIVSKFANDNDEEMEKRKKRFRDTSLHHWIAKRENTIIGFCFAKKDEDIYRIRAIYVLSEYQGKGVGTKLMHTALSWLRSDKDIFINVAIYNTKAIKFYERFGFSKTGKTVQDSGAILASGKIIPEIELICRRPQKF